MAKALKKMIATELKAALGGLDGWVLVDTTGLDAHSSEEIRSELRSKGLRMMVVKNTLAKRIFDGLGNHEVANHLEGPTGILFGEDGTLAISKVLIPWRKKNKLLAVRAGLLDGVIIGASEVDRLAAIPDRPVLLAQFVGLLNAPLQRLIYALGGPARGFSGLVSALKNKMEEKK